MYKQAFEREEAVRLEAFLLSEKAGHPRGKEEVFWAQAEALVGSRGAKSAPKRKSASKPAAAATVVAKPARKAAKAAPAPPAAAKTRKPARKKA